VKNLFVAIGIMLIAWIPFLALAKVLKIIEEDE